MKFARTCFIMEYLYLLIDFRPKHFNMTQSIGLFEMINPELLSTETLTEQIKLKLILPVFSVSRSQLGTNEFQILFYLTFLLIFQMLGSIINISLCS